MKAIGPVLPESSNDLNSSMVDLVKSAKKSCSVLLSGWTLLFQMTEHSSLAFTVALAGIPLNSVSVRGSYAPS